MYSGAGKGFGLGFGGGLAATEATGRTGLMRVEAAAEARLPELELAWMPELVAAEA